MTVPKRASRQHSLRARVREFGIPPIHDGLVVGKSSPIGCVAIRRALELLVAAPFEHIELQNDEVIGNVLVRGSILRRVPKDMLIKFVLEEIKPLMGPMEILHLDIEAQVTLEQDL